MFRYDAGYGEGERRRRRVQEEDGGVKVVFFRSLVVDLGFEERVWGEAKEGKVRIERGRGYGSEKFTIVHDRAVRSGACDRV